MATASPAVTKPPFDLDATLWGFVSRELGPTPGRLNAAIRSAISACTMLLIGEACHSEVLFVALFLPLLIPRDTPQQTWGATKGTIIIAWSACISTIALVLLVAELPWARVMALALGIFVCMILSRGLHQPAVAAIAPVIITLSLTLMDTTDRAETAITRSLWLALMMSAGDLVATAVDFLYPHPGPRQLITREIVNRLQAAAAVLKQSAGLELDRAEQKAAQSLGKLALAGTDSMRKLLVALATQPSVSHNDVLRLSGVLHGLDLFSEQALQLKTRDAAFNPEQQSFAGTLLHNCQALVHQIECNNTAPCEAAEMPPSSLERQSSARLLADMGDQLNDLWRVWSSATTAQEDAADVPTADAAKGASKPAPKPGPFVKPDDIRFAVKVTLACMICYVLYNGVAWQGISTSLLTCFFCAEATIGGTFRKLALRLTGVLVGSLLFGIAGIALITSHMDNIFEFALYIAVVFFTSGWVAKGSPRISYAGSQIGISFGLVMLMTSTIPDGIVEPRNRLMGVLLGMVVMWFVFTRLWPVDTLPAQKKAIAGLLQTGSKLVLLTADASPTNARSAKVRELRQAMNGGIKQAEDQADLSEYESKEREATQALLRRCLDQTRNLLLLEVAEVDLTLRLEGEIDTSAPWHKADVEEASARLCRLATQVIDGQQGESKGSLDGHGDRGTTPVAPAPLAGNASDPEKAFWRATANIQSRRNVLLVKLSQSVEEVTLSETPV